MNNKDRLREHLSTALNGVLTALVLSGGDLGDDIATDAIDSALSNDPSVGIARQAFLEALRGLDEPVEGEHRQESVLAVEAATNALVARAADVAYRLGFRVGHGMQD